MTQRRYAPELEALLPALPAALDLSTTEKIRELRQGPALFPAPEHRDDVALEDVSIPGPDGAPEVPVRIYRPKASADAPRPCVLELHGGGFLFGNLDMTDSWCERVAAGVGAVVVSVDYRLAPENPFPAGLEDCYAALGWVDAESATLGIDAARIALAGQSAGGALAAATALLTRDRGGPRPCFQVLEIPVLDDRLETPSMLAFTDTPLWNLPNARWSWRHYLGPDPGAEVSPYAAPARAKDLSGLPDAYVSTMEFDPLRDEGIQYALRLLQAGVSVELHSYAGTFHGSTLLPGVESTARNAEEVVGILRRRLTGSR